MTEPQTNISDAGTGRKKAKICKMLSDEVVTAMAKATWESSSIGQEERRRHEEEQRLWANPEVGDEMPDGSVYAGISPNTGKQMFAMPQDADVTKSFNEAAKYAQKLNEEKTLGHDDWHVPTKEELNVLFNNRAAIGGFNLTGSYHAGYYWSSSPYRDSSAWGQRFSDGDRYFHLGRDYDSSVRCVR